MLTQKSENYITVVDWYVYRSSQSSHIHEAVNRQDWPQEASYITLQVQWERFCFTIILFTLTQLPDHGSYVQYLALICLFWEPCVMDAVSTHLVISIFFRRQASSTQKTCHQHWACPVQPIGDQEAQQFWSFPEVQHLHLWNLEWFQPRQW